MQTALAHTPPWFSPAPALVEAPSQLKTTKVPVLFWPCYGLGTVGCEDFTEGVAAPMTPSTASTHQGVDSLGGTIIRLPNVASYPGDLITDILEYRHLRARSLNGDRLGPRSLQRYTELRTVLCAMEDTRFRHGRSYNRFAIDMPAKVRIDRRGECSICDVRLENISAGGVRVAGMVDQAEGDAVELLLAASHFRTVVIPARIAWMRDAWTGLMFAGAARRY